MPAELRLTCSICALFVEATLTFARINDVGRVSGRTWSRLTAQRGWDMAIIVQMPAPRLRSGEVAAIETGATILFFTGVRYERDVDFDAEDPDDQTQVGMVIPADEASIVAVV